MIKTMRISIEEVKYLREKLAEFKHYRIKTVKRFSIISKEMYNVCQYLFPETTKILDEIKEDGY